MARRPRALLVGTQDEGLRALFSDVLDDLGVDLLAVEELDPADLAELAVDLVVAAVEPQDGRDALREAHRLARGAPVVAVLPFADDVLSARALELGAAGCYCLGTTLDELRRALSCLMFARDGHQVRRA